MRRLQTKDPTLIQVLSLYLLLLAFFIVLFSASRYDSGRVAAVGESLAATFEVPRGTPGDASLNTSQQDGPLANDSAADDVVKLVRTEMELAEIKVLRPGRLIQIRLSVDEVFAPASTALAADKDVFFAKLADLLRRGQPGHRHKVEVQVGTSWVTPDQIADAVPLSIGRSAIFAENLLRNGALPGTVMGGISFEDPGKVTLLYRVDPDPRPETGGPATDKGIAPADTGARE